MLNLNHRGVEIFIKRYNKADQESFWENYNLLIWKKNPNGFTSINGMFRKNTWGQINVIPVNDQGVWVLPKKYVRYFK